MALASASRRLLLLCLPVVGVIVGCRIRFLILRLFLIFFVLRLLVLFFLVLLLLVLEGILGLAVDCEIEAPGAGPAAVDRVSRSDAGRSSVRGGLIQCLVAG